MKKTKQVYMIIEIYLWQYCKIVICIEMLKSKTDSSSETLKEEENV